MRLSGDGLACIRGGRDVFTELSFSVAAGEALIVTGANGSGKTSLLRIIAGLLRLAAGKLDLAGGPADATIGEQAHYLGHQDALKPALTVEENLAFWSRYLGPSTTPNISAALAAVGLDGLADIPSGYLSAGQRRRLSIARLVAAPRPIWLLDEPSAALDGAAQAKLSELMRGHLAGGGIIVAATHAPLGLDGIELRLGAR